MTNHIQTYPLPTSAYLRLAARAIRAAAKPNTLGKRAGDFPPDQLVVSLDKHLLIEGQTMRSYQKDLNRITSELHKAERGLERRKQSLAKAHEYIKDLKARGDFRPKTVDNEV